jgi:hypothetical protein
MTSKCLNLWLDYKKRSLKRVLEKHFLLDKFYPHPLLLFTLDISTAYPNEINKFTTTLCYEEADKTIHEEIEAIKEIFTIEDQDSITWNIELLSNKYMNERIDSLIAGFYTYIEARHRLGMLDP